MKRLIFSFIVLLALQLSTAIAQDYKIVGIKAYMVYNKENSIRDNDKPYAGTLSENIIDNPDVSLWNVIIGSGTAKAASDQTLVMVEVGLDSAVIPSYRVVLKIEVLYDGQNIFSQDQELLFFENQNYHHALLLNDTGCETLTIKARLVDARSNKTLTSLEKTINYKCGE